MARTDILAKALLIVEDAREDAARSRRTFSASVLRTLGSAGDFHTTLAMPEYPHDAQSQDLKRIGQDMYAAMERHAKTQASPRH